MAADDLRLVYKTTDLQRLEVLALSDAGMPRKEVAALYGLTRQGVSHIVCRAAEQEDDPE